MAVFLGATQNVHHHPGISCPLSTTLREAAEDAKSTLAYRRREREYIKQTGRDLFGCTRGR